MPTRPHHFLLTSLLLLSSTAILAQQTPADPAAPAPERIYLDVVVTPKSGPPVAGLQQQDFTLLDNNVAQPIATFSAVGGPKAPLKIILVVDAVNASYETVGFERDQINKFLLANGGELPYPTTLALVTDTGTQVQQGTSTSGKELSDSLAKNTIALRTIRRSAGFYGAEDRFQLSLKALTGLIAREQTEPGRKIILWVSPGWPLFSGPRVELDSRQQQQIFGEVTALSAALRQARITLYSIDPLGSTESLMRTHFYMEFLKGVTKPSKVDPGDLALQVLATQSGGLVLNANNDITGLLHQAVDDAKAFYEISFDSRPGDHPAEYHQLQIQLDKPGLIARTRTGYYTH
jgi:VWFA-related protein